MQFGKNLSSTNDNNDSPKIIVPGVGVLEKDEALELAKIEKVANINVPKTFDFERLAELKSAVDEYKKAGVFVTEKELEEYNGFINTIEKIIRIRKALEEKEKQVQTSMH